MTPEKFKEIRDNNKIIDVANKLGLLNYTISSNTSTSINLHCPNTSKHSHNDNNPSLALLPRINRFKCFSCGIYGDVISLVQLTKGFSLQEAVKWLDPLADLYPSNHQEAKQYLKEKGFTPETLKKFSVFVGETWDCGKKFECVYFPIPTGKKYRLFGCPNCKFKNGTGASGCIFKTIEDPSDDLIILSEGEIDAMIGWQNTGYPFWTSTAGTMSFENKWVDEFRKFQKVVIGFDNDEAGKAGAENTIKKLIDGGINREKIIQIEVPEILGKDWSDYFAAGMGKKDFDELINNSRPP